MDDITSEHLIEADGIDPEFLNDFILDTKEHIEKIEMHALLLETEPDNMEAVRGLFREFHTIKGTAGFVDQHLIQDVAHQTETLLDACRTGRLKINRNIIDLILNSTDIIKKISDNVSLGQDAAFLKLVGIHTEQLLNRCADSGEAEEPQASGNIKKIGEILVEEGKIQQADVDEILAKQQTDYSGLKFGQIVIKEKKAGIEEVVKSLRKQENEATASGSESGYMRIPVSKVDNLIDMLGELIIIQSLVEQDVVRRFDNDDEFLSNLMKMSRITKDIQNISMSLRMVSLTSTFRKLYRIGRDTVAASGKNIAIQIAGEDTEIDRGIAEKIFDPLIHIVKNCISHGIEDADVRAAKGKPPQGCVKIDAYNKRGNIYIEVSDDGNGIDIGKIYRKAVEKKLVSPSVNYSPDEMLNFIFMPGFSTAETVDSISGRGVGLDVVKTELSKIGGKVEIINNPGAGCAFILKIPINMAVINGTIVDILGSRYIIPTLSIKRIVKPEENQWVSVKGKRTMVRVRDEIVPVIPLSRITAKKEDAENEKTDLIIVIELEQKQKALAVSGIIGKQEIVVKSLGYGFNSLDFISGASILGDGKVSLILDLENLFRMEAEN